MEEWAMATCSSAAWLARLRSYEAERESDKVSTAGINCQGLKSGTKKRTLTLLFGGSCTLQNTFKNDGNYSQFHIQQQSSAMPAKYGVHCWCKSKRCSTISGKGFEIHPWIVLTSRLINDFWLVTHVCL